MTGRIDVHAHLLPGVDDGCATVQESIACARLLIEAGYTHAFCTPHIWPNLSNNTVEIAKRTKQLQAAFDANDISLQLFPGGELNLRPDLRNTPPANVVTYGLAGKYVLFDMWAERLPGHLRPTIEWMRGLGLTVILAHPERMRAVQDDPKLADELSGMGILLQGNLQCLSDAPHAATRQTMERFLQEDRYFVLGTDLHNPGSLPMRIEGLARAEKLVGAKKLKMLTAENPHRLLPQPV